MKPVEPVILQSKVRVFLDLYKQRQLLQKQAEILDTQVKELQKKNRQIEEANQRLEELATHDALTGIPNRRLFDSFLENEWKRARRSKACLSLILVDIDYFKYFNDYYGHQAGDQGLRKVSQALFNSLGRSTDLVARYGGEEFAVVLPETNAKGAKFIAEILRSGIESLSIPHKKSEIAEYVTISLGTAVMVPGQDCSAADLISTADKALYEAKNKGRNREKTIVLEQRCLN